MALLIMTTVTTSSAPVFCVVNVWWMLFSLLSYLNWYLEIYDAILEVYAVILYAGSSLIEFLL